MRTDVAPGLEGGDRRRSRRASWSPAGCRRDSSKDLLIRLTLEMLGVPFKYVTGYRPATRMRGSRSSRRDQFLRQSPPGYRSVVEPSLVKNGQVIPLWSRRDV